MLGDFAQLHPVRDTPLYQTMCGDKPATSVPGATTTTTVRALLDNVTIVRLSQQMRALPTELDHRHMIETLATVPTDRSGRPLDITYCPITRSTGILQRLEGQRISAADFSGPDGLSWQHDALVVVSTNATRQRINLHRLRSYAISVGQPILCWRLQLRAPWDPDQQPRNITDADELIRQQLIERVYTIALVDGHLHSFFVPGAPVFLGVNFNVSKGVANGTPATMHSLHHDTTELHERTLELAAAGAPGEIVPIPRPTVVAFELTSLGPAEKAAWPPNQTIVPGRVVVPLPTTTTATGHTPQVESVEVPGWLIPSNSATQSVSSTTSTGLTPAQRRTTNTVTFISSPYHLAYCVTFHKLQGITAQKVILDLSPSCILQLPCVYVALTRTRTLNGIRTFPGSLRHLSKLHLDQQYTDWLRALVPVQADVASSDSDLDAQTTTATTDATAAHVAPTLALTRFDRATYLVNKARHEAARRPQQTAKRPQASPVAANKVPRRS